MNDIQQLVREALDRRRERQSGCFVHNAAAVELLEHGADAVSAIENEVLALAAHDRRPRDLDSVMVIYSRLVRRLEFADRCVAFLRRLPQPFRQSALAGVSIAWHLRDPLPGVLPESLRRYVEHILARGTEAERRTADRILQLSANDHAA